MNNYFPFTFLPPPPPFPPPLKFSFISLRRFITSNQKINLSSFGGALRHTLKEEKRKMKKLYRLWKTQFFFFFSHPPKSNLKIFLFFFFNPLSFFYVLLPIPPKIVRFKFSNSVNVRMYVKSIKLNLITTCK